MSFDTCDGGKVLRRRASAGSLLVCGWCERRWGIKALYQPLVGAACCDCHFKSILRGLLADYLLEYGYSIEESLAMVKKIESRQAWLCMLYPDRMHELASLLLVLD